MKIGIIGAGQIGGTLTRKLAAARTRGRVANSRDPQTLAELAAETGATAVWAADAAARRRRRDRQHPAEERPRSRAGHRQDREARRRRDRDEQLLPEGTRRPHRRDRGRHAGERVGLPAARSCRSTRCSTASGGSTCSRTASRRARRIRIALPIAGADGPAKQLVFDLVDSLGFDPVDGGDARPIRGGSSPVSRSTARTSTSPPRVGRARRGVPGTSVRRSARDFARGCGRARCRRAGPGRRRHSPGRLDDPVLAGQRRR